MTGNARRRRRYVLGAVAALGAGLAAIALATARGATPAFSGADGRPVAGAVAEERWIELGGVRQYVLIRGRDRTAPLLVNVHGGPGMSERALYRYHNAALEDNFTVAYWDQRGAGKSFDPALDPATLTIDRMSTDLGELIDTLLGAFGQERCCCSPIPGARCWRSNTSPDAPRRSPPTSASASVTNQLASEAEGYAGSSPRPKRGRGEGGGGAARDRAAALDGRRDARGTRLALQARRILCRTPVAAALHPRGSVDPGDRLGRPRPDVPGDALVDRPPVGREPGL
ncbi:MAG: hypothetical protein R3D80_20095 [Paracoccaceae bacterium]